MKSEHKIQSRDYGLTDKKNKDNSDDDEDQSKDNISSNDGLTLNLLPVPKCISLLRQEWSPHAFCVSFKLETDTTILSQKATMAMDKYKVHMVIGNILATRHDKVWVLQKPNDLESILDGEKSKSQEPEMVEITKSGHSYIGAGNASKEGVEELEDSLISHVVEKHFEYIANHYPVDHNDEENSNGTVPRTALIAGAEAAARHNAHLREKKRELQRQLLWKRIRDTSLNIGLHALGMYLSYTLSYALNQRLQRRG